MLMEVISREKYEKKYGPIRNSLLAEETIALRQKIVALKIGEGLIVIPADGKKLKHLNESMRQRMLKWREKRISISS